MTTMNIVQQFEQAGAFFPVIQEPLVTASGRKVEGRLANVREDTGQVLGVVSKGYKVVPYQTIVEKAAESLVRAGLDVSEAHSRISFAKNGGRMLGVITLPNEKMYVDSPNGRDEHALQVLLRSGHDADFFVDFRPGAVRIACFNGNYIVDQLGQLKSKHTKGFDPVILGDSATRLLGNFKEAGARWSEWSQRTLTDEQARRVIGIYSRQPKEILNLGAKGFLELKEKRETKYTKLVDRYMENEKREIGATAWGVYNTLTWDATHGKLKEGKEATSEVLRHANVTRTINDRFWREQLKLAA